MYQVAHVFERGKTVLRSVSLLDVYITFYLNFKDSQSISFLTISYIKDINFLWNIMLKIAESHKY